jgi:hypothetical protein
MISGKIPPDQHPEILKKIKDNARSAIDVIKETREKYGLNP